MNSLAPDAPGVNGQRTPRDEIILAALRQQGGVATVDLLIDITKIPRPTLYRRVARMAQAGQVVHQTGKVRLSHPVSPQNETKSHSTPQSEIPHTPYMGLGSSNTQPKPGECEGDETETETETSHLVQLLVSHGMAREEAQKLASEHADRIEAQVAHLDWTQSRGTEIASKPAWLKAAITRPFDVPEAVVRRLKDRQVSAASQARVGAVANLCLTRREWGARVRKYRLAHPEEVARIQAEYLDTLGEDQAPGVKRLLAVGYTNDVIAERLGLGECP